MEIICLIHWFPRSHLTFLSLYFFMWKMEIITPSSQGHYENLLIDLDTLPNAW